MPIYQTNDYTLLQVKEKKVIVRFKPKLNKTWIILTYKWTQIYIDMYTEKNIWKNNYQYISNHTTTHK